MNRVKIFISQPKGAREKYLCKDAMERLSAFATLSVNNTGRILKEKEMTDFISDVDGLIIGWGSSGLTVENLRHARCLKIISLIGSSVKHIEPEFAMERGIVITNTASAVGYSVAEFTIGLIFSLLRDIPVYNDNLKARKWVKELSPGSDLRYKKVGLIGVGSVGRIVAELLKPFHVSIKAYDPYLSEGEAKKMGIELVPLEEILSASDVISIHAGLTEETRHMINREKLNLIRKGAVLVNTARGGIIDQNALVEILKKGHIKAGLDVFEEEPLPQESELRSLPNVILTPHVAGLTIDTNRRVGLAVAEDMELFSSGKEPHNRIHKEQLERMT